MSPDTIDSFVLKISDWIDDRFVYPDDNKPIGYDWYPMEDDKHYDSLSDLLHNMLEPFVTKDRNYN
jgi:hypothetical protein